MRMPLRLALGLIPVFGLAQAQAPTPIPTLVPSRQMAPEGDPLLASILQEALGLNPELAKAKILVEAEKERIPQAGALPDPSLSLGLQNDGFKQLQIGKMESSYYSVMLTQPLPFPGKRGLRVDLARLGVEAARWASDRARLSLIADVKRAYFGLLLVRGQLDLLDKQEFLWQKASEITRVRYEVGKGSQADVLRAQLEQNRLRQTRLAFHSEERAQLATLNRLRWAKPDAPIPTPTHLQDLKPGVLSAEVLLDRAEKESPELEVARIGVRQAKGNLDLAQRDRYPDFALSAGVMPRGSLEPMWQVGVSVALPIWSKHKQQRAVAEQESRRRASGSEVDAIRNLLTQRILERAAQLEAALETLRLYREGILVQGEATFQASLAQYETGQVPFLSVLEALNGWIADEGGFLQTTAQALAAHIAQEEFNLSGTPAITAQGLSAGSMGMGQGGSARPSSPAQPGSAGATSGEGRSAMTSM